MSPESVFLEGRSYSTWRPQAVEDEVLRRVHDLAKHGPTSANCSPARYVFVRSAAEKAKLAATLAPVNIDAAMAAPVNVIVGMDMEFYEQLPRLFPDADARSWFAGKDKVVHDTAFRNSTLQGAYLILAARMLGLDAGPISGFDPQKVDELFFSGTPIRSNFIINLGYGDPAGLPRRAPRPSFDDVAKIL